MVHSSRRVNPARTVKTTAQRVIKSLKTLLGTLAEILSTAYFLLYIPLRGLN
jgi:hypothetical protein